MSKLIYIAIISAFVLAGCGGGSAEPNHIVNIVRTPAQLSWVNADIYCSSNAFAGQSGWRLPTQSELIAYAKSGADNGGGGVWSSTPAQPTYHYWVTLNGTSGAATAGADYSFFYVRCAHD